MPSGLTTGDAKEAAMKHTLAGRGADTSVLASAEKIGAVSPNKVLELAAITAILTDAHGNTALDALRDAAPEIIECEEREPCRARLPPAHDLGPGHG